MGNYTMPQTEEVLEFVMQYEGEVKILRDFLQQTKSAVEEARETGPAFNEETWLQLRNVSVFAVAKRG